MPLSADLKSPLPELTHPRGSVSSGCPWKTMLKKKFKKPKQLSGVSEIFCAMSALYFHVKLEAIVAGAGGQVT